MQHVQGSARFRSVRNVLGRSGYRSCDAVLVVLAWTAWTPMLLPSFDRNADFQKVENNTFVINPRARKHFSLTSCIFLIASERHRMKLIDSIYIEVCQNSSIFQPKSHRKEMGAVSRIVSNSRRGRAATEVQKDS
jgi:hypothetical protein